MTVEEKLQIYDPANSTKILMKQLADDDGSTQLSVNTDDMLNSFWLTNARVLLSLRKEAKSVALLVN